MTCRSQGVDLLLLVNVNKLITLNTGIHDVSACSSSPLSVLLSREIHPLACLCPEATSRAVFWLCADKSKSEIQLTHLAIMLTVQTATRKLMFMVRQQGTHNFLLLIVSLCGDKIVQTICGRDDTPHRLT